MNRADQRRTLMPSSDAKARLQALRRLLDKEESSTQEELREQLESLDFAVTQSTVSRDLRRLGAIKMTDAQGRTTYRLALEEAVVPLVESLGDLVRAIDHNGAMIVLQTTPGSASLVARHIDNLRSKDILGTIAGDDTIFVAPASVKRIEGITRSIKQTLA